MLSCGVCSSTDTKIIHRNPASLGHGSVGEVIEVGAKCIIRKVCARVLLSFLE